MRPLAIPLGAALIVVLAACQTAPAASVPPAAPEAPAASQLSDTDSAAANVALDALAAELGIARDQISVKSVEAVDWPDSSLGCPKPDMAYLSVVTPGHRVTLLANGKLHSVHEADNKAFVCQQARSVAGATSTGTDLTARKQMLKARKDLAMRLNVTEADIRMGATTPTTWVDASLGCPEAGIQYAQVETEGWLLVLNHGAREYTYHADAQRVLPCPAITAQ
jgi:hypothetical protein